MTQNPETESNKNPENTQKITQNTLRPYIGTIH